MFADNPIIFTDYSSSSYRNICDTLEAFYSLSGLKLNSNETKFFVVGIPSGKSQSLANMSGFQQGVLPVRYLGVPLIPSLSSNSMCQWKT